MLSGKGLSDGGGGGGPGATESDAESESWVTLIIAKNPGKAISVRQESRESPISNGNSTHTLVTWDWTSDRAEIQAKQIAIGSGLRIHFL